MSALMSDPATPRRPPPFTLNVRVYWEVNDAGGVVYYANYLKFFERARTEWLRAAGIAQQALRDETGAMFVVADARIAYRQPARLDDVLAVSVQVARAGRVALTIEQQARRDGALLAEAQVRIGCVDAATLQPRRIPDSVLNAITT
jgi:acyl-CoA thioester hydrolase